MKPGDKVKAGQIIGYVGQAGNVYGFSDDDSHLHFEAETNSGIINPEKIYPVRDILRNNPESYGYAADVRSTR